MRLFLFVLGLALGYWLGRHRKPGQRTPSEMLRGFFPGGGDTK